MAQRISCQRQLPSSVKLDLTSTSPCSPAALICHRCLPVQREKVRPTSGGCTAGRTCLCRCEWPSLQVSELLSFLKGQAWEQSAALPVSVRALRDHRRAGVIFLHLCKLLGSLRLISNFRVIPRAGRTRSIQLLRPDHPAQTSCLFTYLHKKIPTTVVILVLLKSAT